MYKKGVFSCKNEKNKKIPPFYTFEHNKKLEFMRLSSFLVVNC